VGAGLPSATHSNAAGLNSGALHGHLIGGTDRILGLAGVQTRIAPSDRSQLQGLLQASDLGPTGTAPYDAGRWVRVGYAPQDQRVFALLQVDLGRSQQSYRRCICFYFKAFRSET
uniref:Uncharacterized protein n=1 Tax=Anopheles albimanus TaxID=7167 RepID=A0A182FXD5_ANOAL